MATVDSGDVRLPRWARDAVARHEPVVVVSHNRPVVALVHPDDVSPVTVRPVTVRPVTVRRRGRPVREVAADLQAVAGPDPRFADDMEAVLASVGPVPPGPWDPS